MITTVWTITIIGILCFSLRSCLYRKILPCYSTNKPPHPHTELQQVIPSPSSTPHPETNEATNIDPKKCNFYNVLTTSQLEVPTPNAGEKEHKTTSSQNTNASRAQQFSNADKFKDKITLTTGNSTVQEETNDTQTYSPKYQLH
jgi:hypothetical protein